MNCDVGVLGPLVSVRKTPGMVQFPSIEIAVSCRYGYICKGIPWDEKSAPYTDCNKEDSVDPSPEGGSQAGQSSVEADNGELRKDHGGEVDDPRPAGSLGGGQHTEEISG